jgi:hypothetical protein
MSAVKIKQQANNIKSEKTFDAVGHASPKESFGPARFSVGPLRFLINIV